MPSSGTAPVPRMRELELSRLAMPWSIRAVLMSRKIPVREKLPSTCRQA
jgi:hypothetical protein